MKTRSYTLLALAAASSLWTAAAHAQTVITSLPYTISSPGLYVLNSNLNSTQTSDSLISVEASNVTLDFRGHYISGPAGNTGQSTIGVLAEERSNVTVKNGTVAYCRVGIRLRGYAGATNAVGELVDNMRVTYCYYQGIEVRGCPASRVQNCQVSQTGYNGANSAYGIVGTDSGMVIQNNVVSTVTATTNGGNGIYASNSFVRQNTVSNTVYGIVGGKYQDNLTYGCDAPYSGGTNAGGNN